MLCFISFSCFVVFNLFRRFVSFSRSEDWTSFLFTSFSFFSFSFFLFPFSLPDRRRPATNRPATGPILFLSLRCTTPPKLTPNRPAIWPEKAQQDRTDFTPIRRRRSTSGHHFFTTSSPTPCRPNPPISGLQRPPEQLLRAWFPFWVIRPFRRHPRPFATSNSFTTIPRPFPINLVS